MLLWRWFVAFVRESDTRDRRIVGKNKHDARWKAEMELQARMHSPKPDIPNLPKDALVYEYGVECTRDESQNWG